MKDKDVKKFTDARMISWQLFEKSGNIAYYLLYKELSKK